MRIIIVPTIREIYKNQFEYCTDLRLIKFLQKTFINSKIDIYSNKIINSYDLIVFSGGNSSTLKQKREIIRNNIDNKVLKYAIKNKIKILGICHGAQFLAKKFNFNLKRINFIGNHKVFFNINNVKFEKVVNSYHNESIQIKKTKIVEILGLCKNNMVEAFHVKDKKILGIMWHPERYLKIKKFDQKLLKRFYATNNFIRW